jgi:adenylyltransferase/sulfurtransferase
MKTNNKNSDLNYRLTPNQIQKYSRHIIMPQIGSIGQRKLLNSKVLIIGAGGLGSPISIYLTLAGVGTIGIMDMDTVEASNLQRQILHYENDIGTKKTESAKKTLLSYNSDLNLNTYDEPLSSKNALSIFSEYDIIINGADNFPARYLACDAAYISKKPLVDGSILLFEGQLSTYIPDSGCYRCLFPEPPKPGEVPSCAEVGVLGILPGIVGSIQATETIKLILGIGKILQNKLLLVDALSMEFKTIKFNKNPKCILCGTSPEVTQLIDYEQFCGF